MPSGRLVQPFPIAEIYVHCTSSRWLWSNMHRFIDTEDGKLTCPLNRALGSPC
jgi:hypothetical protein